MLAQVGVMGDSTPTDICSGAVPSIGYCRSTVPSPSSATATTFLPSGDQESLKGQYVRPLYEQRFARPRNAAETFRTLVPSDAITITSRKPSRSE